MLNTNRVSIASSSMIHLIGILLWLCHSIRLDKYVPFIQDRFGNLIPDHGTNTTEIRKTEDLT